MRGHEQGLEQPSPPTAGRTGGLFLGFAVLLLLLIFVGIVSYSRAAAMRFDFSHFYQDARFVWDHACLPPLEATTSSQDLDSGENRFPSSSEEEDGDAPSAITSRENLRALPFYLPAVPVLLSPVAAAGPRVAAAIWTGMHLVSTVCILALLTNGFAKFGRIRTTVVAFAVLIALPAIYEAARFNQLSFLILVLVLAAVATLSRGRPFLAGGLLGAATVFKLLPVIFAIWLALRREWTALTALILSAALVAVIPCVLVFGPRDTVEYHAQWFRHNLMGAPARGMLDPSLREHFIDRRNQSIAAVVGRLFWPDHPHAVARQPFSLSESGCIWTARLVWTALFCVLLLATGWARRSSRSDPWAQTALYLLAMLILSPLLRQYYLIWALPALAVLAARASAPDNAATPARLYAWLGVAVWLIGMLAWLSPTARAYGVHLAMLIALAGLLVVVERTSTNRSDDAGIADAQEPAPPASAR